jgi:23S rRNA (guanosine2251-2'-O)-methyltransferase
MKETAVWIWGRHPVLESLRSRSAASVLVAAGRRPAPILDEIRRVARRNGTPLREAPASEVDRIAPGENTQGVAARVTERRLSSVQELLELVGATADPAFVLAFDQLQDPHNVGALIRTAAAAGVHGVVLPDRRTAPVAGTVARVSAGAVSHVPILEVTNLAAVLAAMQDAGIWVVGLDAGAPATPYEIDLRLPTMLVVGGEERGLRRLTRERCDVLVSLPMRGPIESLNASVAGSIVLYEVLRQRR